jgi:hypothetical protein
VNWAKPAISNSVEKKMKPRFRNDLDMIEYYERKALDNSDKLEFDDVFGDFGQKSKNKAIE